MNIELREFPDKLISVLDLAGRFDAYNAGTVREYLHEITDQPSAQVIVNLSRVDFIDSMALATLVQSLKHCRQKKGDLYLCGLQQPVKIIFELTRLDKAFKIFVEEDAAVEAFMD